MEMTGNRMGAETGMRQRREIRGRRPVDRSTYWGLRRGFDLEQDMQTAAALKCATPLSAEPYTSWCGRVMACVGFVLTDTAKEGAAVNAGKRH